MTATLEIDSLADMPAKARIPHHRARADGQASTVDAALKKGRNVVKAELPLDRPALWWPNGQGAQPLYTLRAELHAGRTAEPARHGCPH